MNKVIVFHQTGDDVLKEGVVFKIYGNVRDDLASTDGDIPDVISREGELIGMQVCNKQIQQRTKIFLSISIEVVIGKYVTK